MLILSRRSAEGIVIDGCVVVRVLAVTGDRVKLGIAAPRSVVVLREELCEELRAENQRAAGAPSAGLVALRRTLTGRHAATPAAADSGANAAE